MVEYKTIYIERGNNGERVFKHERTVFDECEISGVFTHMCETPPETYKIREIIAAGIKKTTGQDLSDKETDITSIQLNMDKLDEEIESLANELLAMCPSVGGDDDSFDYFPDIVWAFEQICIAVGGKYKYDELMPKLNKALGYDDEDDELYFR